MLRLEGHINGKRISREFEAADPVAWLLWTMLDNIHEKRLDLILGTLLSAAEGGRSWGWSASEFSLTLTGKAEQ